MTTRHQRCPSMQCGLGVNRADLRTWQAPVVGDRKDPAHQAAAQGDNEAPAVGDRKDPAHQAAAHDDKGDDALSYNPALCGRQCKRCSYICGRPEHSEELAAVRRVRKFDGVSECSVWGKPFIAYSLCNTHMNFRWCPM